MGLLDFSILVIAGSTLIITSILLIVSLRSTEDKTKKNRYKKTYGSMIIFCVFVIMADLLVIRIAVYMHQYM